VNSCRRDEPTVKRPRCPVAFSKKNEWKPVKFRPIRGIERSRRPLKVQFYSLTKGIGQSSYDEIEPDALNWPPGVHGSIQASIGHPVVPRQPRPLDQTVRRKRNSPEPGLQKSTMTAIYHPIMYSVKSFLRWKAREIPRRSARGIPEQAIKSQSIGPK
jgi:hypothetical protein